MSHPIPLFLWFTDEICGVGRTAEACRADAHRRDRTEHAAYAAETASEAAPDRAPPPQRRVRPRRLPRLAAAPCNSLALGAYPVT